ncbi:hypothetical protein DV736_g6357, partial [Chaetothyriales sp. CBS 134916]
MLKKKESVSGLESLQSTVVLHILRFLEGNDQIMAALFCKTLASLVKLRRLAKSAVGPSTDARFVRKGYGRPSYHTWYDEQCATRRQCIQLKDRVAKYSGPEYSWCQKRAYVLTGVIAIFLYSSRLYTNRGVLRDIPKAFLPIDKDDLPNRRVWVLIQERLARAAVAAYHAKPRARRIEVEHPIAGERILLATKQVKHRHHQSYGYPGQSRLTEDEKKLLEPKWGDVQHPGWRSPAAKDMPGLEYADVVNQLVDLVEANAEKRKERVIDLVTRPEHFGMRQYMGWLTYLGVVPDDSATESFIRAYERARFAAQPLSTSEFDDLMRHFAELLRSMKPLEPGDLLDLHRDGGDDRDKDAPPPHHLPPSRISEDSAAPSMSEDEDDGNGNDNLPPRSTTQMKAVPGPRKRIHTTPRHPSRKSSPPPPSHTESPASTRSRSTMTQGSNNGSVIRLRLRRRDGDDSDDEGDRFLPYAIEVGGRKQDQGESSG